jgi:omega-6 fatty acid desaturase (delta-12 desaturase)
LYPTTNVRGKVRARAFADLALIVMWLLVWCCSAILVGIVNGKEWFASLFWGVALPFFVWNCLMGLTVYLQHTHHLVPWFRSEADARHYGHEELAVNVKYPRWYGILSHEIMEHPAHHVNPLIPFYRLRAAQEQLNLVLGEDAIVEHMGLTYLFSLVRRCKLYDYDRHEWTDFSGQVTGQTQSPFMSPHAPGA